MSFEDMLDNEEIEEINEDFLDNFLQIIVNEVVMTFLERERDGEE